MRTEYQVWVGSETSVGTAWLEHISTADSPQLAMDHVEDEIRSWDGEKLITIEVRPVEVEDD